MKSIKKIFPPIFYFVVSDISIKVEIYVNFLISQFNISKKIISKLNHE